MHRIGFDNDKYLKLQSQNIRDRISKFGGKLYLEFGGKLFDDYHASRVLPGFAPDSKVRMLLEMKDEAEIVIAISADDIERSKRLRRRYPPPYRRLPRHRPLHRQCRPHTLPRSGHRRQVPAQARSPRCQGLPPLHHPRLPLQHPPHRLRRGLRPQRLHRNLPQSRGRHRPRPRQRQNGYLPQPALP